MRIGHSVVVENKPGASGVTGATYVWRANPDGYTLLVNALADVQNLHYLAVPYDPIQDFALIGMITDGPPLVLIVNANVPYRSIDELIAYAKDNPNTMSFGTSGPATSPEYLPLHVAQAEGYFASEKIEVTLRVEQSENDAAQALARGRATVAATSLDAAYRLGHVKGAPPALLTPP